jgi:hypothetical protein
MGDGQPPTVSMLAEFIALQNMEQVQCPDSFFYSKMEPS